MTAQTIAIRGKQTLQRWVVDKDVRRLGKVALFAMGGLVSSAASLSNAAMPLAMGLVSALTGWRTAVAALGAVAGYWIFWGSAGFQGIVWTICGCLVGLFLGKRTVSQEAPFLIPAVNAFLISTAGLLFQVFFRDETPLGVYLLRIFLGAGTALLMRAYLYQKTALTQWMVQAVAVFALAQVAPMPWISLGFVAAGVLGVGDSFPAVALAGVALDFAGVSQVSMTAVLCTGYLLRMIPWEKRYLTCAAPAIACFVVSMVGGILDFTPLPALLIGGIGGILLPQHQERIHRRGETGMAQVRLEIMSGVLSQTQQLLLEVGDSPIDEEGILCRVKERACGGCPNRKQCQDITLPPDSLRQNYTDAGSLGFLCRKSGRMLTELRRGQEQLRNLRADRQRQRSYREAVVQQYQFLSEYLRQQADLLPRGAARPKICYQPEVAVCSAGKQVANGDRCVWFTGTMAKYYILLCDGMGTGTGAAQEAKMAADLLQKMLTAGYPAEYALRSVNSLTVLRQRAGAVTVDLAEIALDSGWVTIYKWGAAPSWVLRDSGAEKIGTAGPPPGLSVSETRETVERLSLRRGETLILLSDGVDGEGVRHHLKEGTALPPGELAARLLELGASEGADDATVAVVRITRCNLVDIIT